MDALVPPATLTRGARSARSGRPAAGVLTLARAAIVALLLALFVRAFLLQVVSIPTDSMVPTLEPGDQVLVNRFVYSGPRFGVLPRRPVRTGDVVVFRPPFDPRQNYVKRCVGLGGDWFDGGVLPSGELWLEGDARERSLDSRRFGAIPESALTGRAIAVLWSHAGAGGAPGGGRILRQVR